MNYPTERNCAAKGADTISRMRGQINNEQRECVGCGHCVVWDLVDAPFFGFAAQCPLPKEEKAEA